MAQGLQTVGVLDSRSGVKFDGNFLGGICMNAKKDRYAVRVSEASYAEMQQEALQDGVKEGVAVMLVTLEKLLGWRRTRLTRVFDAMQEILLMPAMFGKDVTAEDAIKHLRKEYGVDVDKLEINVDINYVDGEPKSDKVVS